MFKINFMLALRSARKNVGYTLINLVGLSISFACCALISLWLLDELSHDKHYENYRQIHAILVNGERHGPNAMASYLQEKVPEIEFACRIMNPREVLVAGDLLSAFEDVLVADASTIDVFSFPFIAGNPQTALVDPNSIVLTESAALKFFGRTDIVGKSLKLDQEGVYAVTGVIEDQPHSASLAFSAITHIDFVRRRFIDNGMNFDAWNFWSSSTYVRTSAGVDASRLSEAIAHSVDQFYDEEDRPTLSALNIGDVYMEFSEAKRDIKIFFSITLAILIMAGINFVNLSTARFRVRVAEVGIRKIVGASRARLIGQFLEESLLLVLAGFLLAMLLTEATLPFFNSLLHLQLSLELLNSARVIVIGGGVVLLTGLASAVYPAIVLSGFQPVKMVKAQLGRAGRRFTLRRALVVFQFALAAIIIIGSITVYDQINFTKSKDVGYSKDRVVNVELTAGSHTHYRSLKSELEQLPYVSSVTGAAGALPYWSLQSTATWDGLDAETEEDVYINFVDNDFLKTYGIDVHEGRGFDRDFAGEDRTGCIVNETLARMMSQADILGSRIDVWGETRTVVGVAEDFNFRPFDCAIGPLAIVKIDLDDPIFGRVGYLSILLESDDIAATLSDIEDVWHALLPDVPFVYSFLDEEFDREYASLERLSTLAFCFCALAVLIAGLGLFGLASFSTEQRIKELAIRKVLGASPSAVILLISREYLGLIALANLAAWPVAGYIMSRWLESFVYRVNVRVDVMIVVGLVTLLIALSSAGFKASQAATTNPVDSLKCE